MSPAKARAQHATMLGRQLRPPTQLAAHAADVKESTNVHTESSTPTHIFALHDLQLDHVFSPESDVVLLARKHHTEQREGRPSKHGQRRGARVTPASNCVLRNRLSVLGAMILYAKRELRQRQKVNICVFVVAFARRGASLNIFISHTLIVFK